MGERADINLNSVNLKEISSIYQQLKPEISPYKSQQTVPSEKRSIKFTPTDPSSSDGSVLVFSRKLSHRAYPKEIRIRDLNETNSIEPTKPQMSINKEQSNQKSTQKKKANDIAEQDKKRHFSFVKQMENKIDKCTNKINRQVSSVRKEKDFDHKFGEIDELLGLRQDSRGNMIDMDEKLSNSDPISSNNLTPSSSLMPSPHSGQNNLKPNYNK